MVLSSRSVFILLLLFVSAAAAPASAAALGGGGRGNVGGRTEIRDVASNREVQDLGRFSVEEYNRRLRSAGDPLLQFARVVAAQRQVVSGVKYYLKIAAADGKGGARKTFEAVVVVKAWLKSRELVSFTPSAAGN